MFRTRVLHSLFGSLEGIAFVALPWGGAVSDILFWIVLSHLRVGRGL